jgi:NitT/TauT family transport system permease protein
MNFFAAFGRNRPAVSDHVWRWVMRLAFLATLIVLWEWFGRTSNNLLSAPFSETVVALGELITEGDLFVAFWKSNQALLLGFGLAVPIGLAVGLLLGRLNHVQRFVDVHINLLLVTPMAALVPLIVIAFGIGLGARVLVVFLFAVPIIVVNTRAGLTHVDPNLVEMARTFGASERQLWQRILLPGATPGIMAGMRLGLGRALTGMIVVELILIAVGLGEMILNAMSLFDPARMYAVVLVIIAEAFVLMALVRRLEARLTFWNRPN